MTLETFLPIFGIGWSHLFSAGVVSPTTTPPRPNYIPHLGRHFVFTIQLEKCSPNFFQVRRLGGACAVHANSHLIKSGFINYLPKCS